MQPIERSFSPVFDLRGIASGSVEAYQKKIEWVSEALLEFQGVSPSMRVLLAVPVKLNQQLKVAKKKEYQTIYDVWSNKIFKVTQVKNFVFEQLNKLLLEAIPECTRVELNLCDHLLELDENYMPKEPYQGELAALCQGSLKVYDKVVRLLYGDELLKEDYGSIALKQLKDCAIRIYDFQELFSKLKTDTGSIQEISHTKPDYHQSIDTIVAFLENTLIDPNWGCSTFLGSVAEKPSVCCALL